jgi:hypothetical protein
MRSLAALTDAAQATAAAPLVKPSSAPAEPIGAAEIGEKPSIYSTLTLRFCAASDFIFTLVEDGNSAS